MINFTPPKDSVKKEKEKEEKEEKSKTGFIPPSNSVAKKEKDVVKTADAASKNTADTESNSGNTSSASQPRTPEDFKNEANFNKIDFNQKVDFNKNPVEQPEMVGFNDVNKDLKKSYTKDKKLKELPPMALISSPEFTKFVESETQKKASIKKELVTQAVNDPAMSKALITNNYTVEDVNILKDLGVENLPEFEEGSTGLVSEQPSTNPFTSKGNSTPTTSYNEAIENALSENNDIYSVLEKSREEKNDEKRFDYISSKIYSENNNLKPEELEKKVIEKMKFNMVETSDARAKSFAGDELYNKWQESKTEEEENNVLKEIFDSEKIKKLVDKNGNFVDKTRLSKVEIQEIQGEQEEEVKQLKNLGVDQMFKLYSKAENELSTIAALLSEKGEEGIFDQSLLVQKGNELLMDIGMSPGKGDKKLSEDFLDLKSMSETGIAPSNLSFLPQGSSPLIKDYNKALKKFNTIQTAIGLNVDITKLDRQSTGSILGEETAKAFGFSDMTLGINEMQNTLLYAMEDELGFEAKKKEIETMGLPGDIYVKQPGEEYFSNEKLLAQLPGFAKMSAEIYFSMGILGGAARVGKITAGVSDIIAGGMKNFGIVEKTAKAFGGFSGGVFQESIGLVGSNTIGSNVFGSEKMAVVPFAVGSQISHLGTNWLGKVMPKAIASYATKSPALGNVVNFTNKYSPSTVSGALKFAGAPIIGATAIKAGELTSGAFDIASGSSDQSMSELWHHITDADSFIETYGALLFMSGAHPNKSMKKLVDNFNSDMVTINKDMAQWNRLANQIGLKPKKTGNWSKKEIDKAVNIELDKIAINKDLSPEQAREQMAGVKALGKRIGIKKAIDIQNPVDVENWNTTYKNLQLTINSLDKGNKLSPTDIKNLVDAGFANNGSSPVLELKSIGFDNATASSLYKFSETSYNEAQQFFKDPNSKNFKNYIESSINEQTNANIKANLKSQYDNKSLSEAAFNFKNKEVEANILLEQQRQTNLIDLAQGDTKVRIKETVDYAEQVKAEGSEIKELNNEEFIKLKSSLDGKESNSVGFGFQTVIDGKPTFVINKDVMVPNKGEYRFESGGKEYVVKGFQGSTLKHEVFHPIWENRFDSRAVDQRVKDLAGSEGDLEAARETIIKDDLDYIDKFKSRLKEIGVLNRVEAEMNKRPGYKDMVNRKERNVDIEKEFINEFLELQNEGALNSLVKDIKFKEVSADVITELKNGGDVVDYFFTGVEQTAEGKAKVKEAQEAYKELVKDGDVTIQLSEKKADELAKEYKNGTIGEDGVKDLVKQYNNIGLKALGYDVAKGDIPSKNAVSFINKEFVGILERYDGSTKLSTWINSNIRPKRQEFYEGEIGDKAKTTSIDSETARQIADTSTPETIVEGKESAVKETERQISTFEGKEANRKKKQILEIAETIELQDLKPGVGGAPKKQLGEVGELIFKVPAEKISNPKKNLTFAKNLINIETGKAAKEGEKGVISDSEFGNIQKFFSDNSNIKRFIKTLPETNVTSEEAIINRQGESIDVSREVLGRGIGLPTRIIKYFYEPTGKRSRGLTSQTAVYKLKPEFKNASPEVIAKIQGDLLIGKDLKTYDRTVNGQLAKGMAMVEAMKVTNEAIRSKMPSETAAAKKLVADIKAGASKLSMSEKLIAEVVNEQGKTKAISEILGTKGVVDRVREVVLGDLMDIGGNLFYDGKRMKFITSGVFSSRSDFKKAIKDKFPFLGDYETGITNYTKKFMKDGLSEKQAKAKAIEEMKPTKLALDAGLTLQTKDFQKEVKNLFKSNSEKYNKFTPEQIKLIDRVINAETIKTKKFTPEQVVENNKRDFADIEKGKDLILDVFRDIYKKNPKNLDVVSYMLWHPNSNSHPLRNFATIVGKEIGKGISYEEHMLPFSEYSQLVIKGMTKSDKVWTGLKKWLHENYNQEVIGRDGTRRILDHPERSLDKNGNLIESWSSKDKLHPELKKQIEEALEGKREWKDVISPDIRKYNEYKSDRGYVNPNKLNRFGETDAKRYNVEVDAFLSENPAVTAAQNKLIYEQLIGDITAETARKRLDNIIKVEGTKEADLAFKNNKADLDRSGVMNTSEKMTTEELVEKAKTIDKALRMADRPNMPVKKIRVLDFDDTIATTNSKVFAEKSGERIELTAEEFAEKGVELMEEGYEMDFTDFNKVVEGKKGPLFDLVKKMKEAPGERDIFILTARAPEAQGAIYEFMKAMGVEIPLENITGLGKSEGEAKANWIIDKAAEGYNDFYFADDAIQNVKAVKTALDVIDVKSKVQQARLNTSERMNEQFNAIIEESTGINKDKIFSDIKSEIRGNKVRKQRFFIPPSAEDFTGLLYTTLGKGSKGDASLKFYKDALLDPYSRAMENLSTDRVNLMADFKALKKELDVPKDLRKTTESGFTNEQAVRTYLWVKSGKEVPGLSKTDMKELSDLVENNPKLEAFADQIMSITKGDGYSTPTKNWASGTITTDLIDVLNTTKRAKYLETWNQNKDIIFSKDNLNKLEAAYGVKYRESMENILKRMKSGRNRIEGGNVLSNKVLDYINNSTGAIMFFNTRSAVLQTISAANFINWGFNNPFRAGKAFANQPQYWKDFVKLINSDYLKDRRNGLKLNISESEIADAAKTSTNKAKAGINYILEKGYLPTKFADSFAIASGGATFYRNRINDLIKNEGLTKSEAEIRAMKEFREVSEISQQSSDPSKISSQQASTLGRVVLQFANTPMQYARIQKRAVQDVVNGRGDLKTNLSKIAYYGFLQNMMFNSLQQGLFALGFGDDEIDEKEEQKIIKMANGMVDSSLRGLGFAGVTVQVLKNVGIDIYDRSKRDRPEYSDSYIKLLDFSPAVKSKLTKFRGAAYPFDSKKRRDEVFEKGFALNNPAYESVSKVITATTNLPLDRLYSKVNNLSAAMDEETETWQSIAMVLGWPEWQIRSKQNYVESPKTEEEKAKLKINNKIDIYKKAKGSTENDVIKKLTSSQQIKMLKSLGFGEYTIKNAKSEQDKIDLIIAKNSKKKNIVDKKAIEEYKYKKLNKAEQVKKLDSLGLSKDEIKALKLESDRVEKLLELMK